jgi:hypothetical protein
MHPNPTNLSSHPIPRAIKTISVQAIEAKQKKKKEVVGTQMEEDELALLNGPMPLLNHRCSYGDECVNALYATNRMSTNQH